MKKIIMIIVFSFFVFFVSCSSKNSYHKSRTIETPNSIYIRTVSGWPSQAQSAAVFSNGFKVVAKKNDGVVDVTCPKGQILLIQHPISAGSIVGKKCNSKLGCMISGVQFVLTGGKSSFTAYSRTIKTGATIEDQNAWILGPDNGLSVVNCIPKGDIGNWTSP
ncbi:hypothetical protein [Francisella sp. 19X1-34]|uniref:hypothetical protein n=1 Tax=Francisella sp. 19X1-34 TaxID=3087177 RepID=UPI002E36E798|nr:hypothetical protein [Francisella sp. 19X1-34]MED7787594.1 hypothetical protein [Francisella sp. 19X1-34]